jgi:hypothetical protein
MGFNSGLKGLRMGTEVKYCLKHKNDPAEFTSSTLGVKEENMSSVALQTKTPCEE